MEPVALLLHKRTRLSPAWAPRLQSIEADAFTNGDFSLFDPNLRIGLDFCETKRGLIMGDMLDAGRLLFKTFKEAQAKRAKASAQDTARLKGSDKKRRMKTLEQW